MYAVGLILAASCVGLPMFPQDNHSGYAWFVPVLIVWQRIRHPLRSEGGGATGSLGGPSAAGHRGEQAEAAKAVMSYPSWLPAGPAHRFSGYRSKTGRSGDDIRMSRTVIHPVRWGRRIRPELIRLDP